VPPRCIVSGIGLATLPGITNANKVTVTANKTMALMAKDQVKFLEQPVADDMLDVVAHLRQHDDEKVSPVVAMVQRGERDPPVGYCQRLLTGKLRIRSHDGSHSILIDQQITGASGPCLERLEPFELFERLEQSGR